MVTMQSRSEKNGYTMEDLKPYPFERSLYIPPFLPYFEIPKFDNYRGKGDPKDHIK